MDPGEKRYRVRDSAAGDHEYLKKRLDGIGPEDVMEMRFVSEVIRHCAVEREVPAIVRRAYEANFRATYRVPSGRLIRHGVPWAMFRILKGIVRLMLLGALVKTVAIVKPSGPVDAQLRVTDPHELQRFLDALRKAESSPGSYNSAVLYPDRLVIRLRRQQEPIEIPFSASKALLQFGPDFAAALQDQGRLEAERCIALVQRYRGRVQKIQTGYCRSEVVVPDEIDEIMSALMQIDGRAYDFTQPCKFQLYIYISVDVFIQLTLVFDRTPGERSAIENPSLPAVLRDYYDRDWAQRMRGCAGANG